MRYINEQDQYTLRTLEAEPLPAARVHSTISVSSLVRLRRRGLVEWTGREARCTNAGRRTLHRLRLFQVLVLAACRIKPQHLLSLECALRRPCESVVYLLVCAGLVTQHDDLVSLTACGERALAAYQEQR